MENAATRCLKYGDVIYLKADGRQAFVSAHDRATPQVRTEELAEGADCPPDLKDGLFEVTKKYQYTQKKSLISELTRNGVVPEEALASDSMANYEEVLTASVTKPRVRHKLFSLFNAYLREKRTNDNEFKQVVGESVLYGQVVQLRHLPTGKFVTIKRTAADVERGALKVVLEDGGQEGSWFQVFSGYRTKPEGAKLVPGEVVVFKGVAFSGNGLHVSAGDIRDPAMLPVDKHPYVTSSKEVCSSPDVSSFKVIPFRVNERVMPGLKDRLCGLSAVSIQDLVANTVYVNFLGAINDKFLYFQSPLTRADPNRISGTECWRLELVLEGGAWCGMPLTSGCLLRIRHLATGTYLAALSGKAKEAAMALKARKGGLTTAAAAAIGDSLLPPTPVGAAMGVEFAGGAGAAAAAAAVGGGAALQNLFRGAVAMDEDVLYDEAFRLVLTRRYCVPDTLWELHTFTKEEMVGTKVYAFFKHKSTEYWLSGAGAPIPAQSSGDPDSPQEEQVYPVVHPEKLERNVMMVLKVQEELTAKILDLQRVMLQLKDLKHVLNKEKIPPEQELLDLVASGKEAEALTMMADTQYPDKFRQRYPSLKRSLQDLVRWLDKNTWSEAADGLSPHVEYQNLLRELGLIDLLVQYMDAARVRLFATSNKLRSTRLGGWVVQSGKLCHRILQLSCQSNEQNQSYLSKYAAMVMSHLSSPLTAPDTLAALYEDNMAQMQTVSPAIVAASVKLIRAHGHRPRFINFLRKICGTRERPMPNNQNWIVADIMGSGRNPLKVFCRAGGDMVPNAEGQIRWTWVIRCVRNDDPTEEVLVDSSQFTHDEEDLTKRAIKEWDMSGDDAAYTARELFIYYCFSLKLIVSLCYGRNSLARAQILRASAKYGLGLEYDTLQMAVTNKSLPYAMRTYMLQVVRVLYVDIEPYQPLKLPRHIRLMSKKGAIRVSLKTAPNSETIDTLIRTVLEQLRLALPPSGGEGAAQTGGGADGKIRSESSRGNANERGERTVGRNTLVLNYLKMVLEMFRLGMMDLNSDVTQEILMVLLEIIQKLDSMPLDREERFNRSYASKVVMQAKKVALATIDFALDMKSEQQCAAVFDHFAQWQRSPERLEFWARLQAQVSRKSNDTMKSGLRALGAGVRAVATLTSVATNKVLPLASSGSLEEGCTAPGGDMEAPPPREDSADGADVARHSGPERWAEEAAETLAADNEDGDFPLFKLDTLRDNEPLYAQANSPVMKLFDLVRYDDQELTARTFQLLERLTSKREKLLEELMRTFVVTDDDLITLATWALKQVEIAQHSYNYMGSLDPEESREACASAAKAIDALTSLLMPLQHITVALGPDEGCLDKVFVSKTTAANCQYLMFDMQIHMMVLKFLKLPLKRKRQAEPHKVQEVEDPDRMEVFRACLEFLRHFMVVGDLDGSNVASHANQRAVLPSLELLLSFLDTHGLPTSDTIIALFINNQADSAVEGEKVIRKLIKLITRYGDKQHAGWLELLGKVMVVDGNPIKRNQMVAMQLITQYGDEMMLLLSGDSGLEEVRQLLSSEHLTSRSTAVAPVSRLSYHTACVHLLADCCFGKEPELVVKASGYMSLPQVLDVLLLQPSAEASEANLRYVQRAYWLLLQHCYFATDTDNTKVQVRNGSNRIWPLAETEGGEGEGQTGGEGAGELAAATNVLLQRFLDLPVAGEGAVKNRSGAAAGSCLIQAVLEEVKRALADPSDALGNADSATCFLTTSVFPALRDYFENHWHSHLSKLHSMPSGLLAALFNHLMDLYDALKRLKDVANSQSVKAELKLALANTRALLSVMPAEANTKERPFEPRSTRGLISRLSRHRGPGGGGDGGSAPSTSQHTTMTASSQKVVQKDWMSYLGALSARVNVQINLSSYEVVEVLRSGALVEAIKTAASSLGMGEKDTVFEQVSLLRLARILAARFGRLVPATCPPICFEKLVEMLCELLGSRSIQSGAKVVGPPDWKPALMVKMVRAVCAAAVLDDGAGAESSEALRNAWATLGLLREGDEGRQVVTQWTQPSQELLNWRQCKYDKLGATRAAVTLLAHPMPEVQLEALKLLEVLLQSGNRAVQGTIYDILKDGSELADAVFANFKAAFDRCRKYVSRRVYVKNIGEAKVRKKDVADEAKKAVTGAVKSLITGGSRVAGAASGLGLKAVMMVASAPVDLGSKVAAKGESLAAAASKSLRSVISEPQGPLHSQTPNGELPGALNAGTGGADAGAAGRGGGGGASSASSSVLDRANSQGGSKSSLGAGQRTSPTEGEAASRQSSNNPRDASGSGKGPRGIGAGPAAEGLMASPMERSLTSPTALTTNLDTQIFERTVSGSGSRSGSASGSGAATEAQPYGQQPQRRLESVAVGIEGLEEVDPDDDLLPGSVSQRRRSTWAISRTGSPSSRGTSAKQRKEAGPVAEGIEAGLATVPNGALGGEEDDDEEVRWEDKSARLNNAENAYEFNKALLKVLKSMVEGHYKNLQNVLQNQPQSTSSLDLVVETVDLLNVLQDNLPTSLVNGDSEVADLMVLVCLFVQEMVQGPSLDNQQSLAGTNFLASCNRIFGCIEYSSKYVPRPDDHRGEDRRINLNKSNVKCALLNLLTSLLEACPSEDVPGRCYEILDFDVIDRQIGRLCRVLGMAGDPPRYPPDGDDVMDCDPESPEGTELINISTTLEDELLLFSSYVLKLHSVTPSRPPPLPYLSGLYNGEEVEKMDKLTPDQLLYASELQSFLQRRLGYVEINWKGQLVEPCYFKLTPECSKLATRTLWCDSTLDRINNTVSPDSRAFPTVKAAELVEVLEDVVDDIELESQLGRNRWLKAVSVVAQYRMALLELTFYLAVGTLIFQALADARWGPHTSWEERFGEGESWKTIVLSVAVMLQSTCTLFLYTSFVYTELNKYMSHEVSKTLAAMSHLGARLKAMFTRGEGDEGAAAGAGGGGGGGKGAGGGASPATSSNAASAAGAGGGGGAAADDGGMSAALTMGIPPPPLDRRRSWTDILLMSAAVVVTMCTYAKFWYFNMLVSASLAGFFVSPFFLVFHFTIYFLDFDSGKQLVMAIQRSGINILNTFVLAVLAIYTFAVVTFLVFKDPTQVDKGDGPPCDTFYQCMGAHMLTGIMGDISNLFNSDLWDTVPASVNEDGLQQARTIFVLFFFMIWNFVLSNIFVGLIASAFEAIRDDQNTITSDRLSKCLICSQDMYLFNEKIQGGFEEHVLKQHNALAYVFFLHHLRATVEEDYTGAESVVRAVLDNAKTTTDKGTWLPVSKSLAVMHANAIAAATAGKEGGPAAL